MNSLDIDSIVSINGDVVSPLNVPDFADKLTAFMSASADDTYEPDRNVEVIMSRIGERKGYPTSSKVTDQENGYSDPNNDSLVITVAVHIPWSERNDSKFYKALLAPILAKKEAERLEAIRVAEETIRDAQAKLVALKAGAGK